MADISADVLTYISTIAAVVSMIAAASSAFSSSKSGRLAEDANRNNDLMSVFATSQEIIAERERIRRAAVELRQEYITLAAFTGNMGGSRLDLAKKVSEEKLETASSLAGRAESVVENWNVKRHMSPKTTQGLMFDTKADLIKIQEIRMAAEDELSNLRRHVTQARDRSGPK